jgi:hypothetical protein
MEAARVSVANVATSSSASRASNRASNPSMPLDEPVEAFRDQCGGRFKVRTRQTPLKLRAPDGTIHDADMCFVYIDTLRYSQISLAKGIRCW